MYVFCWTFKNRKKKTLFCLSISTGSAERDGWQTRGTILIDGWMDVWWMITSWTIMDGREHPTGWMMMEASKGKSGLVWRCCLWFLDLRFCACRHGRAATACPHSSLQLSCLSSSSSPSTHFFVCFFVCLSFSSAAAHLLLDLRCRTAPLRCLLQRSVVSGSFFQSYYYFPHLRYSPWVGCFLPFLSHSAFLHPTFQRGFRNF